MWRSDMHFPTVPSFCTGMCKMAKGCMPALCILLDCVQFAQLAVRMLDSALCHPLFCDYNYL